MIFLFELVGPFQDLDLFFHVPELPDLRNVHADAAEDPADIAYDAGSVLDYETHVERHVDVVFRLKLERSRRDQARRAAELAFAARELTHVAQHRHRGRSTAGSGANQNV